MKKMAVAVIVSAALAGGYFYFQGSSHAAHTPAPSSRVISVTTGTVGSHSIAQSLSLIGKLQAEQAVTIASEVAAKVKSIEVKPNTRVQKGALLLQLEDDKARAAYNEALAYRNDESRKLNDFKRLISVVRLPKQSLKHKLPVSISLRLDCKQRKPISLISLFEHHLMALWVCTISVLVIWCRWAENCFLLMIRLRCD